MKWQQSLPRRYQALLVLPRLDRFTYKGKRELGKSGLLTEIQFENTFRGRYVSVSSFLPLSPN